MKRTQKLAVAALTLLIAAGCAPLTEAQRDDIRLRKAEYQEEFIVFRTACFADRGRIVIDALRSLDRNNLPRPGDRYYCTLPGGRTTSGPSS